jgi:hypothetical protein
VKDFYILGLWNYCAGNFRYDDESSNIGPISDVTNCSEHQSLFWFNPVEVWGLNKTLANDFFDKRFQNGLKTYSNVTKWMTTSYLISLIATVVEIGVGLSALSSRWGSLATTVVSFVSSIAVLLFALTATILYSMLKATFSVALKNYNIHSSLGETMSNLMWVAVGFSWTGAICWLFGSYYCSGRRDGIRRREQSSKAHHPAKGKGKGGKKFPKFPLKAYNYAPLKDRTAGATNQY